MCQVLKQGTGQHFVAILYGPKWGTKAIGIGLHGGLGKFSFAWAFAFQPQKPSRKAFFVSERRRTSAYSTLGRKAS